MLQVIKKWRVVVDLMMDKPNTIQFYIHDNHYHNVLRKLSDISFDVEITRVKIEEVAQGGQLGYKQSETAYNQTKEG